MLRELVKDVGILYVATNTIGDRRLPTALEKISVGIVIETVKVLRLKGTSLVRGLLTNGELGVPFAHTLDHHHRRIVESEVVSSPVSVDLGVDSADEVDQRSVVLQCINHVGLVHRDKNYDRLFLKLKP
jgi:hypothetical protein